MDSMSGYFFDRSKSGGLTIHPSMRRPSNDLYQTSSTSPRVTPARSWSLTWVRRRGCGERKSKTTTSPGACGLVSVPTACPLRMLDVWSMCFPVVTGLTSPLSDARYRFVVPSLETLKYSPLPSAAHVIPDGVRSRLAVIARWFAPSAPMTYSLGSMYTSSVASYRRYAISFPSGDGTGFQSGPLWRVNCDSSLVVTSTAYTSDSAWAEIAAWYSASGSRSDAYTMCRESGIHCGASASKSPVVTRSEEHTSELQSRFGIS